MKRWIALMLGIIALAAGFMQLRSMAAREAQPAESISAQSRDELDEIVRRTASVPRSEPKASGEAHEDANEDHR